MWEKEKNFEILEELEHYDLEDEIGDDSLRLDPDTYLEEDDDEYEEYEFEEDLEVPLNTSENIALLIVFWDDTIGPVLTEYLPKDAKFSFELNDIANQLFQAVTSGHPLSHLSLL